MQFFSSLFSYLLCHSIGNWHFKIETKNRWPEERKKEITQHQQRKQKWPMSETERSKGCMYHKISKRTTTVTHTNSCLKKRKKKLEKKN